MRRVASSLTILFLAGLPAVAAAEELCDRDVHRWLRVNAARSFIFRSIFLPPPPAHQTDDFVVGKGGTVVGQQVRDECRDVCSTLQNVVVGIGGAERKAELRDALAANEVGHLGSCFEVNDLTLPTGVRVLGTWELTWYGLGTRANRILIRFGDPGQDGGLPSCGEEARNLLAAVTAYVEAIEPEPDQGSCRTFR